MKETCPICGLPKELCMCKEITKEGGLVTIKVERRKKHKLVTIIQGLDESLLKDVEKELKRKLACGGTIKDREIELRGNHAQKIKEFLLGRGFREENIFVTGI